MVRLIGLALVLVGSIVLGTTGFGAGGTEPAATPGGTLTWNVPVVGGITLVTGLLLLAGHLRRD